MNEDIKRLVEAAQAVSDATRQTLSGQWIISGDGEVLSCNLAEHLASLTTKETDRG